MLARFQTIESPNKRETINLHLHDYMYPFHAIESPNEREIQTGLAPATINNSFHALESPNKRETAISHIAGSGSMCFHAIESPNERETSDIIVCTARSKLFPCD